MSRVFLSYRRSDSQDVAGRIFDRLILHLSQGSVFKDVDSIPAGVDFSDRLQQALSDCSAVLVLIGPTYLTCTDSSGRRRLFDDPDDFVRREVEAAFALSLPIIPVTVSNATMPVSNQLPQSLRPLAKINGLAVRPDPDFNRDIDRLLAQLAPFLGGQVRAELEQRRQQAARIRERLSFLGWQFDNVSELMNQGYPLIEGAAYIAQEVGRRLGAALCPRILRERLAADNQLALSTAIVGWWQARLPARLDRSRAELQHACADLSGQFKIFHHLVSMFEVIWRDSYSPHIFSTIMGIPGEMLLRDVAPDLAPTETVQALTSELHGNAALYYVTRYERATRLMNQFLQQAVRAFKDLGDDDLFILAQGSTADAERKPTRTQTMRAMLNAAETRLPSDEFATLHKLIDAIEQAVSKKQASAQLELRERDRKGVPGLKRNRETKKRSS
jgi:hypothetical protein